MAMKTALIALAATLLPSVAARPQSPADSVMEIAGDVLTVRQDLRRGGAICHISLRGSERNIVNIYDEGRYIQQSYYAGRAVDRRNEGQSPRWSPWRWNPIQGGNYAAIGSRIVACNATDTSLYVKCIPMLWDMDRHPAEAAMEQWTTLRGNTIEVRNRLTCHRTDTLYGVRACDQEIPAVYPVSSLKHLYAYLGPTPFTGDTLSRPEVVQIDLDTPGSFWGRYPSVGERWMAFVDDQLWGIGVYSPRARHFIAGRYRAETDGEATSPATSYIAPLCPRKLGPTDTFDYTYFLVVDTLANIRATIYDINLHQQQQTSDQ